MEPSFALAFFKVAYYSALVILILILLLKKRRQTVDSENIANNHNLKTKNNENDQD